MTARDILNKYDAAEFKARLGALSNSLGDVQVSGFTRHTCVDCGRPLSHARFKRCRSCNMRRIGGSRKK